MPFCSCFSWFYNPSAGKTYFENGNHKIIRLQNLFWNNNSESCVFTMVEYNSLTFYRIFILTMLYHWETIQIEHNNEANNSKFFKNLQSHINVSWHVKFSHNIFTKKEQKVQSLPLTFLTFYWVSINIW